MSGRIDYEERKQTRIDHLNEAAYRASKESSDAFKRSHDLVKDIPLGQPNIHGALTGIMNKARSAADRSIELSDKADYYATKADAAEKNTAISSDDPEAVRKLQEKIAKLEAERERIKAFNKEAKKNGTEPAPWYTLPYLSRDIKAAKERIAKLERIDAMPEETIEFDGGEIISDAELNRIQIRYNERQSAEITDRLKSSGFHWSPSEKAWQRLRSPGALRIAKTICGLNQ